MFSMKQRALVGPKGSSSLLSFQKEEVAISLSKEELITKSSLIVGLNPRSHPTPPPPHGGPQLNLLGGMVASAMPEAKKRSWGDTLVTQETTSLTEKLLLESRPSSSQNLSLFRAFDRWRTRNFPTDISVPLMRR